MTQKTLAAWTKSQLLPSRHYLQISRGSQTWHKFDKHFSTPTFTLPSFTKGLVRGFTTQTLPTMETKIVRVPTKGALGEFKPGEGLSRLEHWQINPAKKDAITALEAAAKELREKDTPVAFPTETVYGLGADATRSGSVKGIYSAKGRPSDNPLIIHVCDLDMLRGFLQPSDQSNTGEDAIPSRYKTLMERFWPGPLTVLMPNPQPSRLAPEVTAGLTTFGVRMPSSPLALSLIKLAGVPLAAPSANASTKPSPTTAQHVMDDLNGRIELILDGGSCPVGVESTVVDGLCDPPVILRPGGIGLDEIRSCPGWEGVAKAYKDHSELGKVAPRAPGMKYKHYSPKAKVVLYESTYTKGSSGVLASDIESSFPTTNGHSNTNGHKKPRRIGIIRTQRWALGAGLNCSQLRQPDHQSQEDDIHDDTTYEILESNLLDQDGNSVGEILDIDLGKETEGIARGLFAALREFDRRGADIIFVDGIEDNIDIAAAVMNRLRKAASEIRS